MELMRRERVLRGTCDAWQAEKLAAVFVRTCASGS